MRRLSEKEDDAQKRGRLFGFLFRLIDLGMRPTCMHDWEGMIQSAQPPPLPSIPRVINKTFLDPSVIDTGIPQNESYIQCSTRYIHTHSANIEKGKILFNKFQQHVRQRYKIISEDENVTSNLGCAVCIYSAL